MWLLNATTLKLEYFLGSDVPPYTILSHTWGNEEVTFQDITQGTASPKEGYTKLVKTCKVTLRNKITYTWIDTCCIDKTSSAELTESLNSMFQWYQKAQVCYVYLSDLKSGVALDGQNGLAQCRWFTRGWTLQELIAPQKICFFDKEWICIGSKIRHSKILSSLTSIDEDVLLGNGSLRGYPVATRMSWAAHRQTSRIEDLAYCLLGIFDVNMPLIYGEGSKAFRRLQEEIVKRSNDLTIFAWDEYNGDKLEQNLFAPSPGAFARSNGITPLDRADINPVFSLTNKGLRMEEYRTIYKRTNKTNDSNPEVISYSLLLGFTESLYFWIPLSKVGPDILVRRGNLFSQVWDNQEHVHVPVGTFYIEHDNFDHHNHTPSLQGNILHVSRQESLSIGEVMPQSHWDDVRWLFFGQLYGVTPPIMAASCTISVGNTKFPIVLCVKFLNREPSCRIFHKQHNYCKEAGWLFNHKKLGPVVTWEDVEIHMPSISGFGNTVQVYDGAVAYSISATLTKSVVKDISNEEIYTLTLQINNLGRYLRVRREEEQD